MKSNKKYSNATFTKRVDHEPSHVSTKHISEPAVCETCGAVYTRGRWTVAERAVKVDRFDGIEPQSTVCPGCQLIREGIPAGFVTITGDFLYGHRAEIENLLRNEENRSAADNPLARIIDFKTSGKTITVTTTTEHLAQHLGRCVNKAYGGDVRYDFSHENKLARVYCNRDK